MVRCALVLLLVASAAHADKKIQAMTPGFVREAQTCATQVSGMKKVQTGASALAPTLSAEDKATLDKDLEALKTGLTGVEAYCTAVTELAGFLETSKDATYKSVERDLDTRDNNVRKLRKASKAIIETMTPITRRWIGRIAQNQVQKPDEPKVKPTAFPGGRSAVLPRLDKTGTWKVDGSKNVDFAGYAGEKSTSAAVTVNWQDGDQCERMKKTLTLKPLDGALTKADGLELVWHARTDRSLYTESMCARVAGMTAVIAISQTPAPTDKLPMLRQLALDLARSQATIAKTP